MRLKQKVVLLCVFTFLFQFLHSPMGEAVTNEEPNETSIKMILQKKERAVNEKNAKLFFATIDQQKPFYVQEQKRWFADAVQVMDRDSYRLDLLSVRKKPKDALHVEVRQSYKQDGKSYSVRLPLRFRKTEEGWKESDLDFWHLDRGNLRVSYTDAEMEESAYIVLDTLKRARYVMAHRYRWQPEAVEVKLYHLPELFRQSVKPSLPFWAGGWNEAHQAIKLVITQQNPRQFASGIVHELTHQMVSDLTHDNAAYWLQEGAAMYYEMHLLPGLHEEILPRTQEKKAKYRLQDLQKMNLEKLPDQQAADYYQSCYQLFHFLVEEYGEEKVQQIFAQLKQSPYLDQDTSDKRDRLNQLTSEAVKQVLHINDEELDQKWEQKNK